MLILDVGSGDFVKTEMDKRQAEVREIAKTCVTLRDLAMKMAWPMETVIYWNDQLKLGLVPVKPALGGPREARAVKKPEKKK